MRTAATTSSDGPARAIPRPSLSPIARGAWVLACLLPAGWPVPSAATSDPGRWDWPLDPRPEVVTPFDPPDAPYGAGHRGVDLAGRPGQPVHAVAGGTVTFAGRLAGRGVVVVDHGGLRSTYEPVTSRVSVGDVVATGQLLGTLTSDLSHCLPSTCLHLGAKTASGYLDPLDLLGGGPIRLKPLDGDGEPTTVTPAWPAAGPMTDGIASSGAAVALGMMASIGS